MHFSKIKTISKQYVPSKQLKSDKNGTDYCMKARFIRTEKKLRVPVCKNTFAAAHNYCHLSSASGTSGDTHPWLRVTSYLCKTCRDAGTLVSPLADSEVGVGSKLVTHIRKWCWSGEAQPWKWGWRDLNWSQLCNTNCVENRIASSVCSGRVS